ncbi:MAG: response regulator [Desulfomonile tiedjei]|uniref:Response regulator n=1 Tax=Desulfomonile tiedjei TaxID=2358 RepID=A0A9D6VAM6_9BACT|nr:response regulator [Desulfomonile tiedjei]
MRLSILFIDDMKPLVTIMENGLEKLGHRVFSALSGREGLEIFRSNPVDVVLCDLGMEGMDGWEVGEAIRKACEEKGVPKTPFILLTGWGYDQGYQERLVDSGVDAILEKPIEIEKLIEVLGSVVK